jgi:hypothetical protein
MKKVILSFVIFIMSAVEAQARVAFIDPSGNIIDPPNAEGITAAEADMAVNAIEVTTSNSAFYEAPLVIGGAIFAVLLIGFVLYLKRRK